RLDQIQCRCGAIVERLETLSRQNEQLTREHQQLLHARDEERRRLLAREQATRLTALEQDVVRLHHQHDSLQRDWQSCLSLLSPHPPPPAAPASEVVAAARQNWH